MIAVAIFGCAVQGAIARADTTVTVDPSAGWVGFMNVFELPANGGGYVFGQVWATTDLKANFSPGILTLQASFVNDTSSFWFNPAPGGPGVPGNKNMDANMYVEKTNTLSGQKVTFTGNVLSDSWVAPYNTVAFIKDFAPDFSSSATMMVPLTGPGAFTVVANTLAGVGRHVQYGFETLGPNAWSTDIDSKGSFVVGTVPEPATLTLAGLAVCGLAAVIRRRR
jgi:hypothetical protein